MTISLTHYLIVGAILFVTGVVGMAVRRSVGSQPLAAIVMLTSIAVLKTLTPARADNVQSSDDQPQGGTVAATVYVPEAIRAGDQCQWNSRQAILDVPVALGGNKVLQRGEIAIRGVRQVGFLVADCTRGKAVAARETSPDRGTDLDPYKVSAKTDINALIDLARDRNELFDVVSARQDLSWSHYDPFCGCALLYPGTPGAEAARTK